MVPLAGAIHGTVSGSPLIIGTKTFLFCTTRHSSKRAAIGRLFGVCWSLMAHASPESKLFLSKS